MSPTIEATVTTEHRHWATESTCTRCINVKMTRKLTKSITQQFICRMWRSWSNNQSNFSRICHAILTLYCIAYPQKAATYVTYVLCYSEAVNDSRKWWQPVRLMSKWFSQVSKLHINTKAYRDYGEMLPSDLYRLEWHILQRFAL